jgi:hypothetical protein
MNRQLYPQDTAGGFSFFYTSNIIRSCKKTQVQRDQNNGGSALQSKHFSFQDTKSPVPCSPTTSCFAGGTGGRHWAFLFIKNLLGGRNGSIQRQLPENRQRTTTRNRQRNAVSRVNLNRLYFYLRNDVAGKGGAELIDIEKLITWLLMLSFSLLGWCLIISLIMWGVK